MSKWGIVEGRLDRLRRAEGQRAVRAVDANWYSFLTAPSCPPDQRVHLRGGLAYCEVSAYGEPYSDRGWIIPDLIADLTDSDQVITDFTYSTSNAYLAYCLVLMIPTPIEGPATSDWKFRLTGSGAESLTAEEAEVEFQAYAETNPIWPDAYSYDPDPGMPIGALILRNDGTIGGRNIMPIDKVNRGRSYLWMNNLRPRWVDWT